MSDIANNRKARHDYQILEVFEAGIALVGTEVKAIRGGKLNVRDAFVRIEKGQAFAYGVDIQPYESASFSQHESKRPRRLLLHKREIEKLEQATDQKGYTLPVLRAYWSGHRVKLELGVGKGKDHQDRRQSIRERTEKREADREVAKFNKQF